MQMTIWEYDEDWNQISCVEQTMPNTAWGFFHDMVVTEDYYLFVENPMDLNLWTFAVLAHPLVFAPQPLAWAALVPGTP